HRMLLSRETSSPTEKQRAAPGPGQFRGTTHRERPPATAPRNASGRSGERPDVIPHPGYARDGERAKSCRTGVRSLAVAVSLGLALTVHVAGPVLRNGA